MDFSTLQTIEARIAYLRTLKADYEGGMKAVIEKQQEIAVIHEGMQRQYDQYFALMQEVEAAGKRPEDLGLSVFEPVVVGEA